MTNPLRTIFDCIAVHVSPELIDAAVKQARARGPIDKDDVKLVRARARQREKLGKRRGFQAGPRNSAAFVLFERSSFVMWMLGVSGDAERHEVTEVQSRRPSRPPFTPPRW